MEQIDYNPNTGELFWNEKAQPKVRNKPITAKDAKGYIRIKVDGRMLLGHRVAWFKYYGKFPNGVVDHINGNPLDNRIENLRDIPQKINMQNQRSAMIDNATGMLGVSKKGCRFRAQITVDQKKHYLGTFETPELAHTAYVEAKRKYHIGGTL